MNLNKNILNIQAQINNTLELLTHLKLAVYYNPISVIHDKVSNNTMLTWNNHISGRESSSNAFLTIKQYMHLLNSGAYHVLLYDYSIIRVSFTFCNNKLLSQNLLWWPCPVKIDDLDTEELTPFDLVELYLSDVNQFRMRSPIRIDFDASNDEYDHPKAHIHTQHENSRMNTIKPICFNSFIKFIFNHYYPNVSLDNSKFDSINLNIESTKELDYRLKEKLIICS